MSLSVLSPGLATTNLQRAYQTYAAPTATPSGPVDSGISPARGANLSLEDGWSAVGREHTAPSVRDGGAVEANPQGGVASQQAAFLDGMKQAGIKASNPPTEAQLKKYFGTFNNAKHRSQALDKFQEYSQAFHVHEAETGHGDVEYSPETNYMLGNKFYNSKEAAEKAANKAQQPWDEVASADASSWKDINGTDKHTDGRHIQDCEGFAFMGQELLGAAGYKTSQVATWGENGTAHAMAVLQDPSGGPSAVVSNDRVFSGKDKTALLDQGWGYATGNDGSGHGAYFEDTTQARAQTRMTLNRASN
ncbi:MAG: hypothetical protein KC910_26275 [Candidatus Eremiobacteraeota bacterium]|nr:hypothetical protein [Candidatus Eremiobacteraeota bacterium]